MFHSFLIFYLDFIDWFMLSSIFFVVYRILYLKLCILILPFCRTLIFNVNVLCDYIVKDIVSLISWDSSIEKLSGIIYCLISDLLSMSISLQKMYIRNWQIMVYIGRQSHFFIMVLNIIFEIKYLDYKGNGYDNWDFHKHLIGYFLTFSICFRLHTTRSSTQ